MTNLLRRSRRRANVIPLGLLTLTAAAFAPGTPTKPVAEASVRMRSEMMAVTGIRELADGRAIVLDASGSSLFLFDFTANRTTRISRAGYGPREYSRPMRLIALAQDSTLVHDPGNDRYLVLGPTGQPIGSLPEFEVRSARRSAYEVNVHGADGAGRLYFTLPRALVRTAEALTPILRFDRERGVADTVGTLLEGADDWVILPEGGVGIVRAEPFRIEWHPAGGEPVIGSALPYGRARFDGALPALLGPDGRLWVARKAGEWVGVATYDIFDSTGERAERMTLPAGSMVVGFGRGRVYVVRRESDGELFLDRFPIAE